MADLRVELCGVELTNPVIASSGPLCFNAGGMRRCFDAGAAAAVTKTIAPVPAVNPVPHIMDVGRGMLLNTEKWADLSVDQWVNEEFPALHNASGVVIASLGHSASAVEALAQRVARVDAVKLLEVTSYYASDMAPMVRAVKRVTDLPVLIKACADWPDFYGVIDDCVAAGVDGITAGDALGRSCISTSRLPDLPWGATTGTRVCPAPPSSSSGYALWLTSGDGILTFPSWRRAASRALLMPWRC